jgi:hypothetical protein
LLLLRLLLRLLRPTSVAFSSGFDAAKPPSPVLSPPLLNAHTTRRKHDPRQVDPRHQKTILRGRVLLLLRGRMVPGLGLVPLADELVVVADEDAQHRHEKDAKRRQARAKGAHFFFWVFWFGFVFGSGMDVFGASERCSWGGGVGGWHGRKREDEESRARAPRSENGARARGIGVGSSGGT